MGDDLHISFDENKALNALLYVAQKLRRKDFHKIFKILYFSDREHLSKYGRAISGDFYIAMPDGPVPSKLYDILKSVRGDGYFPDKGKFSQFFEIPQWDIVQPKRNANLKALSGTDKRILDEVLEKYGDLSWDEIREKSHDYAWNKTGRNSRIKFEDIVTEAGDDESYIQYLKERTLLQKLCS